MKKKPILFIVLGTLLLVEPVFKILYFKLTTGFEWSTVISNILAFNSPSDIFHFWLLFPIAGVALLSVKKWSHPVFIFIQAYSIFIHMTYEKFTWPYLAETPFIGSLVLLCANAILIAYFLFPHVRKPFFDKNVRWWEHHTRFNQGFPCTFSILNPNQLIDAEILNISFSGAFIDYKGILEDEQYITLNLTYDQVHIKIQAEKISSHIFAGKHGIGVKFVYSNFWEKLQMRRLIKVIAKANKVQEKIAIAA